MSSSSPIVWIVNGEEVVLEEPPPRPKSQPPAWSSKSLAKQLRAPPASSSLRNKSRVYDPRFENGGLLQQGDFPDSSSIHHQMSSTNPLFAEQPLPVEKEGVSSDEEEEVGGGRDAAGSFITPLSEVMQELKSRREQQQQQYTFKPKKESDDSSSSAMSTRAQKLRKFSALNVFHRMSLKG